MTRIEKHLPIPSIQLEDITIDLSDIVTREQAGEFDEPAKKQKKQKVQAKSAKQENNEDSELDIASLVSTPVPEFELIENKVLESEIRAMYTETPDLLILSKQTVHTPFALCWEILENMGIDANKKFLVVSALEFVVVLLDVFKVPKENIFFLDEGQKDGTIDSIKAVVLEKFGFGQHQILSIGGVDKMKFDYVVGNPPFTNGSLNGARQLYVEFFELATRLSDSIGMVMPVSTNKVKGALNNHNARIGNAKTVQIDIKEYFPSVSNLSMWYVIWRHGDSVAIKTDISNNLIPWGNIPYIDGGKFKKSIEGKFANEFGEMESDGDSITIYHKINGDGVAKYFVPRAFVNSEFLKKLSPDTGYTVLVSQSAVKSHGFHTAIVKNTGNELFMNNLTKSVYVHSLEQAEFLVEKMKSTHFADLIWENRNPRGDQISPTVMRTIDFGFSL